VNRSIILVLLLLTAAILAGLPNALSATSVRVEIKDSEFAADVAISRGTTVIWVQDDNVQTVINENGISNVGILRQRDSFDYRYNGIGVYRNYYRINPSRVETVIVTETPAGTVTGTSGRYSRTVTGTSGRYSRTVTGTSGRYTETIDDISETYTGIATGTSGRYTETIDDISETYTGIATDTPEIPTETVTITPIATVPQIPTIIVPPISTMTAQ